MTFKVVVNAQANDEARARRILQFLREPVHTIFAEGPPDSGCLPELPAPELVFEADPDLKAPAVRITVVLYADFPADYSVSPRLRALRQAARHHYPKTPFAFALDVKQDPI